MTTDARAIGEAIIAVSDASNLTLAIDDRQLILTAPDGAIRFDLRKLAAALAQPRPERVEDEAVARIAKAIVGPHKALPPGASKWSLDDLREVRWNMLSSMEKNAAICSAKAVLALARPAPKPAGDAPAGWKLVPEEPTAEMRQAGRDMLRDLSVEQLCTSDAADTYRAMLAASPSPANADPSPKAVETR